MKLTAYGRLTAASDQDRTLRGMLLPYGEPGYTNLGRVTAARGVVTVPAAVDQLEPLQLGHRDLDEPAALFTSVTDTPEGLMAEWHVPATPNGDRLLAEFHAGLRTMVSVELDAPVVKGGQLVSAQLAGAAAVVRGAYASARLAARYVHALDGTGPGETPGLETGDTPARLQADYATESENVSTETYTDAETGKTYTVTTTRTVVEKSETSETDPGDGDPAETDPPEGDPVTETLTAARGRAAAAPADLFAIARGGDRDKLRASLTKPRDFMRLMAQFHATRDPRLLAALQDITASDHGATMEQPAWVGELWSGVPYVRRVVPMVNHDDLTAYKVQGWRWLVKPTMAPYAGDKAAVPSNKPTSESVTIEAERLAGAHDIDRKYRDFGDEAFFSAYYAAMAESYARQSDVALGQDLKAAATVVVADPVPADVSPALAALVDGALAIVDEGTPSFALVAKDIWRQLLLTRKEDVLAFLTMALSMEDGTLSTFQLAPAPAGVLDTGEVLVGARSAATFHELGGGAPIRVSAVDMVNGGEDHGCFGYYATNVHDAAALALVDITADA